MHVASREGWRHRVGGDWARFIRWLRPLLTTRADLLRHRLGLCPRVRRRTAAVAPRFFFSSLAVPGLCAMWRRLLPREANAAVEQAENICRHRFDLLGYANVSVGSVIDWHCDPVHGVAVARKPWFRLLHPRLPADPLGRANRRLIWALSRHQHLVTLAKVYRASGDGRYATEVFCQWRHWHAQNPYPMGVNWVSSREVALRSLSWCWLYHLLADSPQLPPGFRNDWLRAMHISGRHLENYALADAPPGGPVLAEGVALFFTGVLCPELEASARWKQRGWEIILREAAAQMMPARTEDEAGEDVAGEDLAGEDVPSSRLRYVQSTSDHVQRLDFFLHACVLASLNQVEIPPEFEGALEKMLEALSLLGRGGAPPRLGGDDGGRVFNSRRNQPEHWLDPLATGAILFGRGDFKHLAGEIREESLWLLGEQGVAEFEQLRGKAPEEGPQALDDADLYLMANELRGQQLIVDARPENAVLASCGDAAALSLSLNRGGRALLIDPGSAEVGSSDPANLEVANQTLVGPDSQGKSELVIPGNPAGGSLTAGFFQYQKDVLARGRRPRGNVRNTLLVQNRGLAILPSTANLETAPTLRAEEWIKGRNFDLFVGSHNGYSNPQSPLIHRRWVFSLRAEFWLVRDLVLGEGRVGLGIFWNLCPELSRYDAATGLFVEAGCGDGLRVLAVEGHGWSQEIRQGKWSPAYGSSRPLHVLHFSTVTTLPAEFVTLLAPVLGRVACEGGMVQIRQSPLRGVVSG